MQAKVIGAINARYLHLPYDPAELRMLPKSMLEEAAPLFASNPA